MNTPSRLLNVLFALIALACIGYYLALGFSVRFGQSMMFVWPLMAAVFLARHVLVGIRIRTGCAPILPGVLVKLIHIGFSVFLISFVIIEGIIFHTGFTTAEPGMDYIVVLGAKVNGEQPGGALRNRIQVASEYWQKSPDTMIIASGGQGSDEGISEAECIRRGLIERGVPGDRILIEDASTSTYENLHNTLAMISYGPDTKIGIVTNNFHIYRALKIANAAGSADFRGIYVHTSYISFPHYMMREYFAFIVGLVTGKY